MVGVEGAEQQDQNDPGAEEAEVFGGGLEVEFLRRRGAAFELLLERAQLGFQRGDALLVVGEVVGFARVHRRRSLPRLMRCASSNGSSIRLSFPS